MSPSTGGGAGMTWLAFVFVTVACWGLYGVLLHTGQASMGDPVNGRIKAFLFVGVAYFLTAVVAPIVILLIAGADWSFSTRGVGWSLAAGIVGAIGALFVLLAFGAGGLPSVVMTIIFSGAPIINAVVALSLHPPTGGIGALRWQFVLGICLAVAGGALVTLYKPPPPKPVPQSVPADASVR